MRSYPIGSLMSPAGIIPSSPMFDDYDLSALSLDTLLGLAAKAHRDRKDDLWRACVAELGRRKQAEGGGK